MGFFSALFGTTDNTRLAEVIKEGTFLVDVHSPGEFSSDSVPGAVNIPLDQLQQQISKFKDKKNVVFFCRSGNRSSMAKGILAKHGFKDVVDGGTWQNVNKLVSN